MPRFEVHIVELARDPDAPADPGEATPRARDLVVRVPNLPDREAATKRAWTAWDVRYGITQRPEHAEIEVTEI